MSWIWGSRNENDFRLLILDMISPFSPLTCQFWVKINFYFAIISHDMDSRRENLVISFEWSRMSFAIRQSFAGICIWSSVSCHETLDIFHAKKVFINSWEINENVVDNVWDFELKKVQRFLWCYQILAGNFDFIFRWLQIWKPRGTFERFLESSCQSSRMSRFFSSSSSSWSWRVKYENDIKFCRYLEFRVLCYPIRRYNFFSSFKLSLFLNIAEGMLNCFSSWDWGRK